MGRGIAQSFAAHGFETFVTDLDDARLAEALNVIEHGRYGLRRGEAIGKLAAGAADAALGRLTVTTDTAAACGQADVVVEAVPEDLGLKVGLFRRLDEFCQPHTILTSNTGGFPIAAMAYATARPERVLGWHWSQPVAIMPFAELIVHERTDEDVTQAVVAAALRCEKNPVVVRDQPLAWGFVVNRINAAVLREADAIVREGVATRGQVDELMKDCFRWPMGPFEMQDHALEGFAAA